MSTNNTLRPCGFVVPYVHGGSQESNGQPVYLVPSGQPGPVDKKHNQPLAKEKRPTKTTGREGVWFFIGTVQIGQQAWDAYGVHHGPSRTKADALLGEFLGDALAQATPDQAVKMAGGEAKSFMDKLIMRLIERQPSLADKPRAELVKMVMAELE